MSHVAEEPMWKDGITFPEFGPLAGTITVDAAIIGGGITGITAAYILSKAGYSVALLEKERLAQGATGYTTAFLTQHIDTDIADLIPMFGLARATIITESHGEAIDFVGHVAQTENIACDFMRCPNYIYANSKEEYKNLEREQQAGEQVGIRMELLRDGALRFRNAGYLAMPRQAKFHPLKYLAGVVRVLQRDGVQIFEGTPVESIDPDTPAEVVTESGRVRAKHVLVATYAPFDNKLYFKKAFYKTYVMIARLAREAVPEAIYEDNASPYHYLRADHFNDHTQLLIGGADHRADIPLAADKSYRALEDYLHQAFADIPFEITRRWDGRIVESVDGLAHIGSVDEEHIMYATAFSGNGMTYSFIAAQIFADAVRGVSNPWAAVYRARRRPTFRQLLHKGRDYSKVLVGGAVKTMFGK